MKQITIQPDFRDLIPPPSADERAALAASIKVDGIRDKVIVWKETGILLDGHTRVEINRELGSLDSEIPVDEIPFADADAAKAWMIENQLGRRNVDPSQRAMLAGKLATLKQGARTDLAPTGAMSQTEAADKFGVSRRAVQRAAKVLREGTPELAQAVTAGDLSVSKAAAIAELPREEQAAAIADSTADGQAAEPTPRPERNGNNLATKAICILAKISKDDFDRKPAFERVRSWLDENE